MQTRLETFAAPVRPRQQVWRIVVGLILVFVVYLCFSLLVVAGGWRISDALSFGSFAQGLAAAETPFTTVLLLMTFWGMILGVWLTIRLLQKRGLGSVFGPRVRVVRDFAAAAVTYAAIIAVFFVVWFLLTDAERNLEPLDWLKLLPLGLVLLLLQTGAEELLFRGWLLQSLAARFRTPVAWAVVPALIFGIAHFDPNAPLDATLVAVGATALFGLFAADLTARTGSLGAAWGFHFVNNVAALLIVGTKGTITGLALYITPYEMGEGGISILSILSDILVFVLGWLAIRHVLAP